MSAAPKTTARTVLQIAQSAAADLRDFHAPAAIIAAETTGVCDDVYNAVDRIADVLLPDRDFAEALRERGISGDVEDELFGLHLDFLSAQLRAAFALGLMYDKGGVR